jgi:hypothetical protein
MGFPPYLAPGAAGARHTLPATHLVFTAEKKKAMLPLSIKAKNHFFGQILFKLAGNVNSSEMEFHFLFHFFYKYEQIYLHEAIFEFFLTV